MKDLFKDLFIEDLALLKNQTKTMLIMKALIIKDLALLKNQTKTMLILAAVCLIVCFINDASFAIGYMALIFSLLVLGTLSYDEYDHGYSFLFTLPFTRVQYVIAKYLLALAAIIAGVLIAFLGILISVKFDFYLIDFSELLIEASTMILLSMVMIGTMIPTRLKYGSENSKIVSGIILGVIFAAVIIFQDKFVYLAMKLDEMGSSFTPSDLIAVVTLPAFMVIAISILLSIRIIKKKEF